MKVETIPAKLLIPEIVQMVGSIYDHKGKQQCLFGIFSKKREFQGDAGTAQFAGEDNEVMKNSEKIV